MANSSRPLFPKMSGKTDQETIQDTEAFFVDSLEAWRKAQNLDKITLLGHSLGGYLSTSYALKYPERVEKLVLISPVGVPKAPIKEEQIRLKGIFVSVITQLWSWNVTPMSVLRFFGPMGHSLLKNYTSRR
jgi:pimeloyl-ACP methyl ester carboxylesterase